MVFSSHTEWLLRHDIIKREDFEVLATFNGRIWQVVVGYKGKTWRDYGDNPAQMIERIAIDVLRSLID